MSFDLSTLDLSEVTADKPRSYIGAGEHNVTVTDAVMKSTQSSGGKYLEVIFANKEGATIRERYNLVNKNKEAVRIAKAQLKAMLEASNHEDPNKPGGVDKLKNLQVKINVGLGKERDGMRYHEVKSYAKSDESVVAIDDDEIPF